MAHFAKLENNLVTQVIVVNNNELLNENGIEQESKGIAFCQSLFSGEWKQTSYNGNIRKNFAGIGMIYDPIRDAFIGEQPFTSWILDENTCQWKAPIDMPNDGKRYGWNEQTLTWVEFGTAPYLSWIFDATTNQWKAPIDYPTDEKRYVWNETNQAWDEII